MKCEHIGADVHPDVHDLVFTPNSNEELWVCSDGGIFTCGNISTSLASGSPGKFEGRNCGLQNLTINYLALHPTEPAVLYCGTQDCGTLRYTGDPAWLHMMSGDGGYAVINWRDPSKVVRTYTNHSIQRFESAGRRYRGYDVSVPVVDEVLFYAPLAGTPIDKARPAEAERLAFGTTRPWLSDTFGGNWYSIPDDRPSDRLDSPISAMVFATHDILYAGTENGHVYRYDGDGSGAWSCTRLDDLGGQNSLPQYKRDRRITDIIVDRSDPLENSIYVCFGGLTDWRRVWHFDGSKWESRSGPENPNNDPKTAAQQLIDIHFNALVADPDNPNSIFAGADLGVWHSDNGGLTWRAFEEGLPDAPVLDLAFVRLNEGTRQLRLLRAATHGRGVYERDLGARPRAEGVELFIRATQLDERRGYPAVLGGADPTVSGLLVDERLSPDIKIDVPNRAGLFRTDIVTNFYHFSDKVVDLYRRVATDGARALTNRVYVQVHNRGINPAGGVRVFCLLAPAHNLGFLPDGYEMNVCDGTPISDGQWKTLGINTISDQNVVVGIPQITKFDLRANDLPPPDRLQGNDRDKHALLVLIHSDSDPFICAERDVTKLSLQERKAALKFIWLEGRP